jgi:NADPH-dependent F420 reductase
LSLAKPRTIAILGGAGALGSGLAARFVHAGHTVLIGSRDTTRASPVEGAVVLSHEEAARRADIAFLTVPFAGQAEVLRLVAGAMAGKILIDATVPLVPPKVGRVQLPAEGSAAQISQAVLGEGVRVVSALQNVGALHLAHIGQPVDCDVLVCGDSIEARTEVIDLLSDIGLHGLHAGPLANAAAAEALTSVLISINRFYKSDRAGIRITGI